MWCQHWEVMCQRQQPGARSWAANSCHNSSMPVVSPSSKQPDQQKSWGNLHLTGAEEAPAAGPCGSGQPQTKLCEQGHSQQASCCTSSPLVSTGEPACGVQYHWPPVLGKLEWIKERVTTVVRVLVHRRYKERTSSGFSQPWGGKAWLVGID